MWRKLLVAVVGLKRMARTHPRDRLPRGWGLVKSIIGHAGLLQLNASHVDWGFGAVVCRMKREVLQRESIRGCWWKRNSYSDQAESAPLGECERDAVAKWTQSTPGRSSYGADNTQRRIEEKMQDQIKLGAP